MLKEGGIICILIPLLKYVIRSTRVQPRCPDFTLSWICNLSTAQQISNHNINNIKIDRRITAAESGLIQGSLNITNITEERHKRVKLGIFSQAK